MTYFEEVPLATHAQLAEIISLRDYMAMAALPGIMENTTNITLIASQAYLVAEAMLEERARYENTPR